MSFKYPQPKNIQQHVAQEVIYYLKQRDDENKRLRTLVSNFKEGVFFCNSCDGILHIYENDKFLPCENIICGFVACRICAKKLGWTPHNYNHCSVDCFNAE